MSDTSPSALARLNFIERALFGITLPESAAPRPATVQPQRHHKCVAQVATLGEKDIVASAKTADDALTDIIEIEVANLKRLYHLKLRMRLVQKRQVLSDEIRREISAEFDQIDNHYNQGGAVKEPAVTTAIDAIGTLCGAWVPLSDGDRAWARDGFMRNYSVESDADIHAAIGRHTCKDCLPNFLALLSSDRAHGYFPIRPGGAPADNEQPRNQPQQQPPGDVTRYAVDPAETNERRLFGSRRRSLRKAIRAAG